MFATDDHRKVKKLAIKRKIICSILFSISYKVVLKASNINDFHMSETVSYVVGEAGQWKLNDGTRIAAGTQNPRSH